MNTQEPLTITLEGHEVYHTLQSCMYIINITTRVCQSPGVPEEFKDEQDALSHSMSKVFHKILDAQREKSLKNSQEA